MEKILLFAQKILKLSSQENKAVRFIFRLVVRHFMKGKWSYLQNMALFADMRLKTLHLLSMEVFVHVCIVSLIAEESLRFPI